MFLHIDIDSFFASAHRAIDPSLEDIPIAVGGRSNLEIFNRDRTNIRLMDDNSGAFVTPVFYSDRGKSFRSFFVDRINGAEKVRGIIVTSSYEARKFGVKTGMPVAQALQLCPHLLVIPSHYPLYHRLSTEIREFISQRIPSIEQFSIDEFFGDIGGWIADGEAERFARELQGDIKARFKINVSIGIARSKWIAKLATDVAKPYGVRLVEDVAGFIEDIPVREFPGIGRGFAKRLEEHYIYRLGEIKAHKKLFYRWNKPGIQLYHRIQGSDNEGISSRPSRKSIGISRTFDPITDTAEVERRVMILARHIVYITMKHGLNPTFFYLKINYEYGIRAKTTRHSERLFSEQLFKNTLLEMYRGIARENLGAVKLSLSVSHFSNHDYKTLSLLELGNDTRMNTITKAMHELRGRYGLDIIKTGGELFARSQEPFQLLQQAAD